MDYSVARMCAELSREAYTDPDVFKKYLFKRVIMHTDLKYFNVDGAQAYGIQCAEHTMIIFRGTEPTVLTDVVADIKAWPRDSETCGNVHAGFKAELDKLYPQIKAWIDTLESNKLIIAGHSLGAAMATLFTAREHVRGKTCTLYTIGSPRVGDREWAAQFKNINAYRFVNTNDIVTTVPFGYYVHVGTLHYLTYTGDVKVGISWYNRTIDKIRGRLRALKKKQFFSGLYDHHTDLYVSKITKQGK